MNALNIAEYMQTVGLQARQASALMARADAATKARALRTLAALLRANVQALQTDNAKDIERAVAVALRRIQRIHHAAFSRCVGAVHQLQHTVAGSFVLHQHRDRRQQLQLDAAAPGAE